MTRPATCYSQSWPRPVKSGSQHDLGEIELDLARCEILIGETATARARAATARQRFQRRGESGWGRAAQLVELEAEASGGGSAETRERLSRVLSAAAAREGDEGVAQRATLVLTGALIDQGRHTEARATLAKARALLRSPHLATRLHARHVSALISDGSGRPDSAARILKRAAEDLGAAGRESTGLDLRTALTVHGAALVGLDLDLAMRGGSASRVLARTELWRDVVRACHRCGLLMTPRGPRRSVGSAVFGKICDKPRRRPRMHGCASR